ncbi:deoxyuridine 5'-triphosphate nucleotidohydrolase [Gordonia liuliyuniae]|uniref:Deoxyuridine 5'-triphosphate nucleotidohydrolase n=1 Tax=Gordonia liuliyuniae TaxID=2911517 RepID=A0ABS9INP6_9ACTN|nr:deoxyuridine 5'-triphosphate nucleotidohydrolase [Gordonia liuliyuniae]MCF8587169.1 deoxyuridine 5'-triphosphate nucleotidohydrolase [Gordonia liuliyuniae]
MSTDPNNDPILGSTDDVDPDLATTSPIEPVDDTPAPPQPAAQQRAELADTVDALHDRLDVRRRAIDEASVRTDQVKEQAVEHKNTLLGVAGGVGAVAVLVIVARRRRSDRQDRER